MKIPISLYTYSILLLFMNGNQNNNNNVKAFTIPTKNNNNLLRINNIQNVISYVSPSHNYVSLTSLSSTPLTEQPTSSTIVVDEEGRKEGDEEKSYLDDGFVFGLEGSGLSRPKGKVAQIVVEGDSLETKPYQVAAVSITLANHALIALMGLNQLLTINNGNVALTSIQSLTCVVSSWILADFGSGVLHWSVDNYGNGRTPIMGGIIAAFQGHHTAPWTITERGFCNNVYKLCVPFGIPTVGLIALLAGPSHPLGMLFC